MDLVYWIMLLKAPIGAHTFYKALKYFQEPKQVFCATSKERTQTRFFKKNALDYFDKVDESSAQADIDWQFDKNCHIITLVDDAYPEQLKTIPVPPPLLYVRGDVSCLSKPQLAIVGSRNPTLGGKKNAYKFAQDVSRLNIIITSGLACGIDATAHIGALEANMETIAVCGTGLDRVYPSKHKSLAHQIAAKGALVSEFPINTPPIANNFPRRNRVISGLSLGTLIVEASIKSGTMITAKLAADQGREVFAIPGSIYNPLSTGCHYLIKQGAKLVDTVEDIAEEFNLDYKHLLKPTCENKYTKNVHNEASIILKYLSYDVITVDEIVEKSGISPQVVTAELLLLEISNAVFAVGAGYVLTK